jgi:hypothetical protein
MAPAGARPRSGASGHGYPAQGHGHPPVRSPVSGAGCTGAPGHPPASQVPGPPGAQGPRPPRAGRKVWPLVFGALVVLGGIAGSRRTRRRGRARRVHRLRFGHRERTLEGSGRAPGGVPARPGWAAKRARRSNAGASAAWHDPSRRDRARRPCRRPRRQHRGQLRLPAIRLPRHGTRCRGCAPRVERPINPAHGGHALRVAGTAVSEWEGRLITCPRMSRCIW